MNSQSDEKNVGSDQSSNKPNATVLRLVPREKREQCDGNLNTASPAAPNHIRQRAIWDGDDDDPGPTAA